MSRRISRPSSSSGRLSYSSSTRSKASRLVFTTELTADEYTRSNLEQFVSAIEQEIESGEIGEQGIKLYDDFTQRLAAQESEMKKQALSTTEKAARNRQLIYNFLVEWQEKVGPVPALSEENTATRSRKSMITKDQVVKIFDDGLGASSLINLIKNHSAADFNIDALSKAASLLGVKGLTAATKGEKGDAKRKIIYNAIRNTPGLERYATVLQQTRSAKANILTAEELGELETNELRDILADAELDDNGTRGELIRRILENQEVPEISVELTKDALERMKNDELQDILRSKKLPYSGMNKQQLIRKILSTQGAGEEKDVYKEIQSIINTALRGEIRKAKQETSALGADELDKVTVTDLRKLAHALSIKIPANTKKPGIISLLTGGQFTQRSVTEATSTRYKSSYKECLNASVDEVREIAKSMGIRTAGVSHQSLCKKIGEEFLHHAINNFLTNTDTFIGDLNKAVSYPTEKQRETAIRAIARRAGFEATTTKTLASLLTQFFISHYRIRALNINPDLVDDVNAYVSEGHIPNHDLRDFARIFSDIDPDLLSVDENAIPSELGILYNDIFGSIMENNERAMDIIKSYIKELNYEIGHSRQVVMAREELREPGRRPVEERAVEPLREVRGEEEVLPGIDVREGRHGTDVIVDPRRALEELEEEEEQL